MPCWSVMSVLHCKITYNPCQLYPLSTTNIFTFSQLRNSTLSFNTNVCALNDQSCRCAIKQHSFIHRVCLSVCQLVHPSIYPSIHPSIHPSTHPSILPSFLPGIHFIALTQNKKLYISLTHGLWRGFEVTWVNNQGCMRSLKIVSKL